MRLLLIPLIAAGYAFGLVTASVELVKGGTPPANPPTAIVWANRVFLSKADLQAWLHSRGTSYQAWAARHPAEAGSVEALQNPQAQSLRPDTVENFAAAKRASAGKDNSMLAIAILAAAAFGLLFLLVVVRSAAYRLRHTARFRPPTEWRRRLRSASATGRPAVKAPKPARKRVRPERPTLPAAARLRPTPVAATEPTSRTGWAFGALLQKSLQAPHDALTRLEQRRRSERDDQDDARVADYQQLGFRQAVYQRFPDFAMYATSVLLACVIGASIALYVR